MRPFYARRNAAVEQERAPKENELNTEIAGRTKSVRSKSLRWRPKAVQRKKHEIQEAEMAANIELRKEEQGVRGAVDRQCPRRGRYPGICAGRRDEGGRTADPKTLEALVSVQMDPSQLVAQAFKGLAENAERIGN